MSKDYERECTHPCAKCRMQCYALPHNPRVHRSRMTTVLPQPQHPRFRKSKSRSRRVFRTECKGARVKGAPWASHKSQREQGATDQKKMGGHGKITDHNGGPNNGLRGTEREEVGRA
eukprot:scaffold16271_cov132-Isochrysis_galbana.AAC.3